MQFVNFNLTYLIFAVDIPRAIKKFKMLVLGTKKPNAKCKLLDKFFFSAVNKRLTCDP